MRILGAREAHVLNLVLWNKPSFLNHSRFASPLYIHIYIFCARFPSFPTYSTKTTLINAEKKEATGVTSLRVRLLFVFPMYACISGWICDASVSFNNNERDMVVWKRRMEEEYYSFILMTLCFIRFVFRYGRGYGWSVCNICSSVDLDVSVVCQAKWRSRKSGDIITTKPYPLRYQQLLKHVSESTFINFCLFIP